MNFRLTAPSLDFHVDVHLRGYGERWIAVADIGGDHELALGGSARAAISASLSSLGERAMRELMADPQLLAISRQIQPLDSRSPMDHRHDDGRG